MTRDDVENIINQSIKDNVERYVSPAKARTAIKSALDYADSLLAREQSPGTLISFDRPRVYGHWDGPLTADISYSFADAQLGLTQVMYHQSNVVPQFGPCGHVVGGTYITNEVNIIYLRYTSSVRVEVSFPYNQELYWQEKQF